MKFIQFTEEIMAKVLISGYYGFKNFGDEAILSVLVTHLKEVGADITVLSSDTDYTAKKYSVNSVRSFDMVNVLKEIQNTDVLISGGRKPAARCNKFKKPCLLFFHNSSCSPFKQKSHSICTRNWTWLTINLPNL